MPCGMWDLSSWTREEPESPAVKAHSLNHWTIREVPGSFTESKVLVLRWSNLSTFHIMHGVSWCLGCQILKTFCLTLDLSFFFPKNFMVLCVTFKSLINFELIFVHGIWLRPMFFFFFFFCLWMSNCSSNICLKDDVSPIELLLYLWQESVGCIWWICFWAKNPKQFLKHLFICLAVLGLPSLLWSVGSYLAVVCGI